MRAQVYTKENFADMDPMHDSFATRIRFEHKTLVVTYDDLDQGVIGCDGLPYYKSKRLTVVYSVGSYCEAELIRDNKRKWFNLLAQKEKFHKITERNTFLSYKYAIDSFREVTLFFSIPSKSKYRNLEIQMDPETITYYWE